MMDVEKYRKAISCIGLNTTALPLFESRLSSDERQRLESHARSCGSCSEEFTDVAKLRTALMSVPVPVPPASLQSKLQVLGSREAQRRRARVTWAARWDSLRENVTLWVNNLGKPLALPTAGGFVSALASFLVLGHSIAMPRITAHANDVPLALYTEASVKNYLPLGFEESEITIEVTVDEGGRVVDYLMIDSNVHSPRLRKNLENHLLFTVFTPARSFGQPLQAKLRLSFSNRRVDVKG